MNFITSVVACKIDYQPVTDRITDNCFSQYMHKTRDIELMAKTILKRFNTLKK